jgi:anti-sigma B factor antagonist
VSEASGHVSLSTEGTAARVEFHGEIDLALVPDVEQCVAEALAIADLDALVVDLTECTYLDSSGLRTLLSAQREAERAERTLSIRGAKGIVRRVIELTKLDHELPLED